MEIKRQVCALNWFLPLAIALTLTTLPYQVAAQSGALDPSYGGTGFVTYPTWSDRVEAIAVQADLKVVVVGRTPTYKWFIGRLTATGAMDSSFGNNGRVELLESRWAWDVAIDGQGRIVVVGTQIEPYRSAQFTVVRLTANGALDGSFGDGGVVVASLKGGTATADAVAIDSLGRIVVAGKSFTKKGTFALALARFTPSGDLDPTFGPPAKNPRKPRKGYTIFDVDSKRHEGVYAGAIALQPSGHIVVGGWVDHTSATTFSDDGWALARFNPDGTVDTGFGSGGVVSATGYGVFDRLHLTGVAVQSDGKIVATGRAHIGFVTGDAIAVRYDNAGNVDSSFGTSGLATTGLPYYVQARQVAIDGDDNVVIAGMGNYYMFAFRWTSSGIPDPSFGVNGRGQYAGTVEYTDAAWTVAMDAYGYIYLSGWSNDAAGQQVFVAKYVK